MPSALVGAVAFRKERLNGTPCCRSLANLFDTVTRSWGADGREGCRGAAPDGLGSSPVPENGQARHSRRDDAAAASLKKFYAFGAKRGMDMPEKLAALMQQIKEEMPQWLALEKYNDMAVDPEEFWSL